MRNQRAIKPAGDHLNQAPFACSAVQRTHNGLTNRHVLISRDDSSVRGRTPMSRNLLFTEVHT